MSEFDLSKIMQETWVEQVHFFDSIDSTNSAALNHAGEVASSQVELFLAESQTAGRGRGANVWWSADGALTFSLLLEQQLPAEKLPSASLTVGLAVLKTVEQFAPQADVALKWPNDVFVGGCKIAGILIELPARAAGRIVIGIGLNVNNRLRDAPPEIRTTATSLSDTLPESPPLDRTDVLVACLAWIEDYWKRLAAGDSSLSDQWREYSLLTGRQVCLSTPTHQIRGLCETIADDGGLVVQTDQGRQVCYGGVVAEFG